MRPAVLFALILFLATAIFSAPAMVSSRLDPPLSFTPNQTLTAYCNATDAGNSITYHWKLYRNGTLNLSNSTTSSDATSLLAGSGSAGYAEGPGASANFSLPNGAALGSDGLLYIADAGNNRIRKINITSGQTYLVAGNGTAGYQEGNGTGAMFNGPQAVAFGTDGFLYVADTAGGRIRRINTTTNETTLVAGSGGSIYAEGAGSGANISLPRTLAFGPDGFLYFSDSATDGGGIPANRIRKINVSTNTTSLAKALSTNAPRGMAVAPNGLIYYSLYYEYVIAVLNASSGAVSTIAGLSSSSGYAEGAGGAARFYYPMGLAFGPDGLLYAADSGNNRIRKINITSNQTYFVAGNGSSAYAEGQGASAAINSPSGLANASDGIYFTDGSSRARKLSTASFPSGIEANVTSLSYPTLGNYQSWVLECTASDGITNSTALNSSASNSSGPSAPIMAAASISPSSAYASQPISGFCLANDADGGGLTYYFTWYVNGTAYSNGSLANATQGANTSVSNLSADLPPGNWTLGCNASDGSNSSQSLNSSAIAVSAPPATALSSSLSPSPGMMMNETLRAYCSANVSSGPLSIRYSLYRNGSLFLQGAEGFGGTALVANGSLSPTFNQSYGAAFGPDGLLYVSDTSNDRIVRLNISNRSFSALSGASLSQPYGLAFGPDGLLYVADYGSIRIKSVNISSGSTATIAGNGNAYYNASNSSLGSVWGVAFSSDGFLFASTFHMVSRINVTSGAVTLAAGICTGQGNGSVCGAAGYAEAAGNLSDARFSSPAGIRFGPDGLLYVADKSNHAVRKINFTSNATSIVAGTPETGGYQEGDGGSTQALFSNPSDIAFGQGGLLFVADTGNSRIRRVNSDNSTTLAAGSGTEGYSEGIGSEASFFSPYALANDSAYIYVSDVTTSTAAGYGVARRIGLSAPPANSQISVANVSNSSFSAGTTWMLQCRAFNGTYNSTLLNSSITNVTSGLTHQVINYQNLTNTTVQVNNASVENSTYFGVQNASILVNSSVAVEFQYNFSSSDLNFSNVSIAKQNSSSSYGYVVIANLSLQSGQTKTVYVDRVLNSTSVCYKDAAVANISELSGSCYGVGEVSLACDGIAHSGKTCTIAGSKLKVEGLTHSAVQEFSAPSASSGSPSYSPTGGGALPVPRPVIPTVIPDAPAESGLPAGISLPRQDAPAPKPAPQAQADEKKPPQNEALPPAKDGAIEPPQPSAIVPKSAEGGIGAAARNLAEEVAKKPETAGGILFTAAIGAAFVLALFSIGAYVALFRGKKKKA